MLKRQLKREIVKKGGLSLGMLKHFFDITPLKYINNEEGS